MKDCHQLGTCIIKSISLETTIIIISKLNNLSGPCIHLWLLFYVYSFMAEIHSILEPSSLGVGMMLVQRWICYVE
jgi:hypothetical protein